VKSYKVKIKGSSPYMQHRMDDQSLDKWEKERHMIIERLGLNTPDQVKAEFHCYRNDDGHCFIPSSQIKAALIEAGKLVKGKVGSATKSMKNIVAGMFLVTPEQILMPDYDCFDKRSAVNRNVKARIITVRPKWNVGWEAEFTLRVKIDTITEEMIKNIIQYAGEYIGIGSFRPTNNGEFGCYDVVSITEMKPSTISHSHTVDLSL
jgi:hypothetical protein